PATAEPVLDLTQHAEPKAAHVEDDIVFETEAHTPPPVETPRTVTPTPTPTHTSAVAPTEVIISPPTASAAPGGLPRLAGSLKIAETQGQTVEGVVRELLKPMLKEWLDRNLPSIVEARVEAELERIARLAR